MTHVATPAPVAAVSLPVAVRVAAVPGLLVVLGGLALARWWTRGEAVPLSWVAPPPELLVLLPVVPVIGLLLLGAVLDDPVEARRLRTLAVRCAAGAALVCAVWLGVSVGALYGAGLRGLLGADNVTAVVSRNPRASAQVLLVWALALVVFLGGRVERRGTSAALALLVGAAALAAAPAAPVVHGHAETAHAVVHAVAGIELLALAAWAGLGVAGIVVRTTRSPGLPQSIACVTLGLGVVVAGALRPDQTPIVWAAAVRGAAVVVVSAVGLRHRARAASMLGQGVRSRVVLVVGDAVVVVAVALLASWLPLAR